VLFPVIIAVIVIAYNPMDGSLRASCGLVLAVLLPSRGLLSESVSAEVPSAHRAPCWSATDSHRSPPCTTTSQFRWSANN